jgi:hypothetical protein
MRSHISVQRATTKYFSNSFVSKNKIEKEGVPRDSPAGLGAGGPRFKSGRPDQIISRIFFRLCKTLFTQNFTVEIWQTGVLDSQVVSFRRLRCPLSYAKARVGRSAIERLLNEGKLPARNLPSMGKIMGTVCISRLIDFRKCKPVITRAVRNYSVGLLFEHH